MLGKWRHKWSCRCKNSGLSWNQFRAMADGKFHFSNGEILMKETFLNFSFWTKGHRTWRQVILGKKRGKKKCEISSQWHFKVGEKGPIVCYCTREQKMNFEGFTQNGCYGNQPQPFEVVFYSIDANTSCSFTKQDLTVKQAYRASFCFVLCNEPKFW